MTKDEENRRKHLLPLAAAALLFEERFIEEEDSRRKYGETRFIAMGPIRRIISFRKANDREVRRYHENQP